MELPGGIEEKAYRNLRCQLKSGISRGVQEKLMQNFDGSWFMNLEFPRDVTQFYRIPRGESLFSLVFLRVK